MALREAYPHIALEMAIPFDGQPDKWAEEYKLRYQRLLKDADIITYTSHEYTSGCMIMRNRYLVTNADLLLAAYDGIPGGTAMTVKYARNNGVQVICIPPVAIRHQSA